MSDVVTALDRVFVLLSPHEGEPGEVVGELLAQAELAEAVGFDGVLLGEHHGGLPGYLPNPLQVTGWVLERTDRIVAGPCPMLLPLRPVRLVAEEVAWLAARHPGRVQVGVAAGAAELDFEVAGVPLAERSRRYRAALPELVDLLSGRPGLLAGDPAVAACREHPVPVVSAVTTLAGTTVAAAAGAGLMLDGFSPLSWSAALAGNWRQAGGTGRVVLSRRVHLGIPAGDLTAEEMAKYRTFSSASMQRRVDDDDSLITSTSPAEVAEELVAAAGAVGADSLSLRVHLPGAGPAEVRDELERLAAEVVPRLRRG
jgi:alkanesulfonate monooxygenase SsuD/methylene tetrahydromethanopterin reductase-like flavin-dependent oxidoreductase (luciferase family)